MSIRDYSRLAVAIVSGNVPPPNALEGVLLKLPLVYLYPIGLDTTISGWSGLGKPAGVIRAMCALVKACRLGGAIVQVTLLRSNSC